MQVRSMSSTPSCDDISEFFVSTQNPAFPKIGVSLYNVFVKQDALKRMRVLDDKIVYALNTSIPTESFESKVDATATCKTLFTQLVINHTNRDQALQNCLNSTIAKLEQLQEERNAKPDDIQARKKLRSEQGKVHDNRNSMYPISL